MPSLAFPPNEPARLAALRTLQILDTPPAAAFDDIVRLAARVCGTSMAAITLIDGRRQWLMAALGLERGECPREDSFCAHTVIEDDLLVVNDAAADPRFAQHPWVVRAPWIRFYAGVPLQLGDGLNLGALCVFDRQPHALTADQMVSLRALTRQVAANVTLGRTVIELERALLEVKTLSGLLPICTSCKNIRDDAGRWQLIEGYIAEHSEAEFTHGICPECLPRLHPDYAACVGAGDPPEAVVGTR